jgi:hypothetical protein
LNLFILKGLPRDFVEVRIPKELGAADRFARIINQNQRKLRYPAFRTVPHREMLAFVPFDVHVRRLDKGRYGLGVSPGRGEGDAAQSVSYTFGWMLSCGVSRVG